MVGKHNIYIYITDVVPTHENPMQAIPDDNMSATMAGYELAVGKYAWNCGLCQWVTCQ